MVLETSTGNDKHGIVKSGSLQEQNFKAYSATTCCNACSLVSRPSLPPVFDRFQFEKGQEDLVTCSDIGWSEAI